MQPIRHRHIRPAVSMTITLLACALAVGWAMRAFPINANVGAWQAWMAQGNPVIQGTFRTENLLVDNNAIITHQVQVGSVPVDPLQQTMLIHETTPNTQGELWIQSSDTGHTGNAGNNEMISIVMRNDTNFDNSVGSASANSSGVDIVVDSTHTGSGSNGLTCTAVRANAACDAGSSNYSLYSEHGVLRNFDPVSFGPGDVALGTNVDNFEIPGSPTTTARIGIGGLPSIDGTQLQTKNTDPSSALAGLSVALDTTLNAGIRGGLVIHRGANGGYVSGLSGGLVLAGGAGFPFAGSQANETAMYNEFGASIVLGADNTGFTSWGRWTPSNHMVVDTGLGTPTLGAGCTSGTSSSIFGNDTAFKVLTGSTSTACTITFKKTYTAAPICTIRTDGSATQPTCSVSATAITCSTNQSATTYDFICIGQPSST